MRKPIFRILTAKGKELLKKGHRIFDLSAYTVDPVADRDAPTAAVSPTMERIHAKHRAMMEERGITPEPRTSPAAPSAPSAPESPASGDLNSSSVAGPRRARFPAAPGANVRRPATWRPQPAAPSAKPTAPSNHVSGAAFAAMDFDQRNAFMRAGGKIVDAPAEPTEEQKSKQALILKAEGRSLLRRIGLEVDDPTVTEAGVEALRGTVALYAKLANSFPRPPGLEAAILDTLAGRGGTANEIFNKHYRGQMIPVS